MKHTYALRNLAAALLGRLRFILVCATLSGVLAFCAARFWMPFHYEAYASMYVKASERTSANVNLNDLNASKSLVGTYIAVLTSQTAMDEASRRLVAALDPETLRAAFPGADAERPPELLRYVKMSAVNDTEVMKITANTRNPEASALICNIIAEIAPSYLIRVVGAGSVEVIDEAVPIDKPVSPNIPLVTFIGLTLGLLLAAFAVLFLDFFDDSVKDAERLSKTFAKPILGEIQSVEASEKKGRGFWLSFAPSGRKRRRERRRRDSSKRRAARPRRKLITDENIPFNIVEGYKSIRSNIIFALGTAPRKIIVVSSAAPHEGKSTTAANVALAFSQISGRVLLIDADLRKPVQHRTFVADNSTGLSTLIISMSDIDDSIRRHVMGSLDLLPSGPLPPNPSELLASAQFETLLSMLSQRYDYIIIDTPPMNVVSDAIVMRGVGGVMLVARYAQATYEDISEAMKKIDLSGANMLGFTLNDVERRPSGYYRYGRYGYYSYSYGYGRRRNQSANIGASAQSGAETPAPSFDAASANDAAFLDALTNDRSPGA